MKAEILRVPGASLYYEVRGSGPVLLMIAGAPADAAVFSGLAEVIADRYTVVTYDQRGLSRSVLDGSPQDQWIATYGDDAHRLLAAVGGEPAYVLGHSGGAMTALELTARHPEQVRALVAFEPPVSELLPDHAYWRALWHEVCDTHRAVGIGPAIQKLTSGVQGDQATPAQTPPEMPPEMMARMPGNLAFYLNEALFLPTMSYHPDINALRTVSPPILVGVGELSAGQLPHQAALALAHRLGSKPVTFPGDHQGFLSDPRGFAEALHRHLQTV